MLKYDTIKSTDDEFLMRTYNRLPALFVQGSGCSLWDNRGNEYLDMLAGIAVCSLGHCHPAVVAAITRQAQQLIHTSNLLLTAPQAQLAKRLCELSGMDRVFFCSCGAAANEAALKIAKKHGLSKRPDGDYQIITLNRSFHGRTLGALSATGQRKYQRSFEPIVPGFVHVEVNNLEELQEAVSHRTAAILLEPIMGEGGILPLSEEYLLEAQKLCQEYNALLMLDEVQSGMGRSGKWFAHQYFDIKPDVMVLAKGLGGGFPIGATLAAGKAAAILEPGDHGSTFGGNPLACAAALAVIDTIEHQDLLAHVNEMNSVLTSGLLAMGLTVTGKGLMVGAALDKPIARDLVQKCFENKLIINATDEFTLRFVPPLIINEDQIIQALSTLANAMGVPAPMSPRTGARSHELARPLHDVLSIDDLSDAQIVEVLEMAAYGKRRRKNAPSVITSVENRTVAMVFEKQSLRTRVSFEAAIHELGGQAIHLGKGDISMGSRDSIADVAQNLSRWCNLIVARLYWQRHIVELAQHATVPVINALTEWEHPCQALADLQTVQESFGEDRVKITYIGDGNNVARSLAKLGTRLGYPVTICGPENFRLEPIEGLVQTTSIEEAMEGASVVYTDVWVSMGDEHEQDHRLKVFEPYQVNQRVMEIANKDAIFLHCLPARRGFEVTAEVIDGAQSRVVDQAENRLHAQKALIQKVLGL